MAQKEQVKVVKNAYLIDGTGKKPVRDIAILIQNDTIEREGIRLVIKTGRIEVKRGIHPWK